MRINHKAQEIAYIGHHGQINSHNGEPYILHPFRLVLSILDDQNFDELDEAILWLHDVVEDTCDSTDPWTLSRVRLNLTTAYTTDLDIDTVIAALDAMTKRPGESLVDYYTRCRANARARKDKVVDIRGNFRLNHLIQDDATRLRMAAKYSLGLDMLS